MKTIEINWCLLEQKISSEYQKFCEYNKAQFNDYCYKGYDSNRLTSLRRWEVLMQEFLVTLGYNFTIKIIDADSTVRISGTPDRLTYFKLKYW